MTFRRLSSIPQILVALFERCVSFEFLSRLRHFILLLHLKNWKGTLMQYWPEIHGLFYDFLSIQVTIDGNILIFGICSVSYFITLAIRALLIFFRIEVPRLLFVLMNIIRNFIHVSHSRLQKYCGHNTKLYANIWSSICSLLDVSHPDSGADASIGKHIAISSSWTNWADIAKYKT